MKISIFPKAATHPRTKEDKAEASLYVSYPYKPVTVEVKDEDDLIELVTNNAWSPSVFREYRRDSEFVSCDIMTFDIDHNLTIGEAEAICEENNLYHIILPSPSHSPEEHRFRLLLPMVHTITNPEQFKSTWEWCYDNLFSQVDRQCSNVSRHYFASRLDDGCLGEGDLLVPQKAPEKPKFGDYSSKLVKVQGYTNTEVLELLYGEVPETLPESVDYFLKNAHTGLPEGWIVPLNAFAYILALQGIEGDKIIQAAMEVAPDELDKRDIDTLERAIRDGEAKKEF